MSQSFRILLPAAIGTAFMVAMEAGCGHSIEALEVNGNGAGPSTSGTTGANGGDTSAGGTNGGTSPVPTCCDKVVEPITGDPPAPPAKMSCTDIKYALNINGHDMVPGYAVPPGTDALVAQTVKQMDNAAKIAQMLGVPVGSKNYKDIERSPDVGNIRGYRYRDAGRGVNLDAGQDNRTSDDKDYATVFPAESARAASWDMDLEWRVGEAMGDEVVATSNNMLLAPCMNIIRHPFWGRTQETYSEDMYHTGRMASAFTSGLQTYVTGCAKHFAANNVEKARKDQNAIMNEQTLREIYGRHFEMVVKDGGVGCIMASYNKINDKKSTQNKHLLTDILRNDFGFKGLVISDWWAMPGDVDATSYTSDQTLPGAVEAANAGLDIEVPWTIYYSQLPVAISSQQVSQEVLDQHASNILTQKFRFGSQYIDGPWGLKAKSANTTLVGASVKNPDHSALAEETEIKAAVLLQNGAPGMPVLPLANKTKIAVIGVDEPFNLIASSVPKSCTGPDDSKYKCTFHFATDPALGDRGSSRVNGDPGDGIGPFAGVNEIAPLHGTATVVSGNAVSVAADADAIVIAAGLTPGDEGEEYAISAGGDRSSLDLPANQNQFIADALALNKPTVIILQSGSIVNLPWLNHTNQNQATIWAGYPGIHGGRALAKLIFADNGANFSGKMPLAWPQEADLQLFAGDITKGTNMGYFFGYRYYDDLAAKGTPKTLVFPFGHGLSYTSFEYSNLGAPCGDVSHGGVVNVTVQIKNTGTVAGDEVAMAFVSPPPKPDGITGDRPQKELKSFVKAHIEPGQSVLAHLPIRIDDLRRWEGDANGHWVIDDGTYTVKVGKSGDDKDLTLTDTFTVHQ